MCAYKCVGKENGRLGKETKLTVIGECEENNYFIFSKT
jgi:hypothetical protein